MWWAPFTFKEGQWYSWHLGGAEICIRREGRNWQGYCMGLRWEKRGGSCSGPEAVAEPEKTAPMVNIVSRKTAALKPFFPEKPFLVNFKGVRLSPGNKITMDIGLPPMLYLIAEKSSGAPPDIIFNFTPFTLKESWFGKDPMEGVICSSIPLNNAACCSMDINCSITIRNKTKNTMELEKIPLYGSFLSIHEKDGKMTSDAMVIDAMENNFHKTVEPINNEQFTLLTQGNKNDPSLIIQGTRIIKNITGF